MKHTFESVFGFPPKTPAKKGLEDHLKNWLAVSDYMLVASKEDVMHMILHELNHNTRPQIIDRLAARYARHVKKQILKLAPCAYANLE